MNLKSLVSDNCLQLQPYKAGLTSESIKEKHQLDTVYKYASNESPFPPSPEACKAVMEAMAISNRYPDYDELKKEIAKRFALEAGFVMLGTGSINVLDILFQTFNCPGNNAVFSSHSYFAYPWLAQKAGLQVKLASMAEGFNHNPKELLAQVDEKTSILVLDNPTNFSGAAIDEYQLERLLAEVTEKVGHNTVVILDQAYAEFSNNQFLDINQNLFQRYPNLVVTRTFSKVHSLASLRIGYGLANPEIVSWFNRVQQPFPVSNVANAAALASLQDSEYSLSKLSVVKKGRQWLSDELRELGVETSNSQANFVLGHFGAFAKDLYAELLAMGLITRHMTVYNEPEYLRISIGTQEENEALIKAIEARQPLWKP